MAREENWMYGVVEDDKPKLVPLLDVLRRLHQHGLTAGMVAAVFHRRRVLPLTQRRLWLDEMTPEASLEGSRMSHESLSTQGPPRHPSLEGSTCAVNGGEFPVGGHRQGPDAPHLGI
jgi:hypothetical protein